MTNLTYLAAAYGVIWLVIGLYLFNISSRLKKLENRDKER